MKLFTELMLNYFVYVYTASILMLLNYYTVKKYCALKKLLCTCA